MSGSIALNRPRRSQRSSKHAGKVNFKVKLPTAGSGQRLDRELDSDPDEPLILEEQFILRLPEGSDVHKRVSEVASRQKLGEDAELPFFKFVDSRRALFGLGNPRTAQEAHPAKLVDLPCIIESHKTLDNGRHMYKVADISQMLIIEPGRVKTENAQAMQSDRFEIDDYVFPHGLTPPMQHVRKRRFRKRTNQKTIEAVERDVESLLMKDSRAATVTYEVIDAAEDLSDSDDEQRGPVGAEEGQTGPDTAPTGDEVMTGGETPAPDADDDMALELDADLVAAMADYEGGAEEESDSSSSSEGGSDIGGGIDDLFGSDEEAGPVAGKGAEVATPMEGVTPAAGGSPDDGDSSGDDDGDPALTAARDAVSMAAINVRDRQAVVEVKTKEAAKLTQPLLRARAEQSIKQLRDSLEQAKSAHEAALAELDRLRRGGDA